VIETNGVEWMRASSGVWHTGGISGNERIKGFQLWVALPPELKLAEPQSQYLGASAFRPAGAARVIAGEYAGVRSPVASPDALTYLDVRLHAGERWVFQPPRNHTVAWIALHRGTLTTPESVGEAVIFEEGNEPIVFEAKMDASFVLGSAIKHPYELVTGHHSVHTTEDALRRGESNIAAMGRRLHNQGILGTKPRLRSTNAA
jgi:redox-sensitive bicupin YhaK (pirin superfamily)